MNAGYSYASVAKMIGHSLLYLALKQRDWARDANCYNQCKIYFQTPLRGSEFKR
jgi:hypothetical protein